MNKRPSFLSLQDIGFLAAASAVILLVSYFLVSVNMTMARRYGGGGDFYLTWAAGRAFLFDRFEPYDSSQAGSRVQNLVYGRAARANENPYILTTPFHLFMLFIPFSLISDPELARAIYTLFLEFGLCALLALGLRLAEWRPKIPILILVIIFCAFNFYSFQTLLEGSSSIFFTLLCIAILYSLNNEMDELAGALLAISFQQWEVIGPFLLLIFIRVYQERRWGVFAGFGMLTVLLVAVSFLWYPNWHIPFIRALMKYFEADYGFTTHAIYKHIWLQINRSAVWFITLLFVVLLGFEWSQGLMDNARHFHFILCLTFCITPLFGFRSHAANFAPMLLALLFIFQIAGERWRRIGALLIVLLMAIFFAVPWFIFLNNITLYGLSAQEILFLFLPVATLVGLYWIRWWALRPPRTWLEKNINRPI